MADFVHRVKYYECDPMGITHHSNYIRFMEEARIDWMERMGFPYEKMEEAGVASPVMSVSCDYKRPTKFPDPIEISLKIEKLSTLKLVLSYKMTMGEKLIATASSTHCFLNKAGRPVSLEKEFPELYAAMTAQIDESAE